MRLPSKLLAALVSAMLLATPTTLPAQGTASSASTSGFGDALNAYRARHGAGPLVADAELTAAAQRYARDMVRHGYFSHIGRDGTNPMVRASYAGCSWRSIGENLANGYASTGDVLQGWANSPSHNRALLESDYRRYGMARVGAMWVLMFADRC